MGTWRVPAVGYYDEFFPPGDGEDEVEYGLAALYARYASVAESVIKYVDPDAKLHYLSAVSLWWDPTYGSEHCVYRDAGLSYLENMFKFLKNTYGEVNAGDYVSLHPYGNGGYGVRKREDKFVEFDDIAFEESMGDVRYLFDKYDVKERNISLTEIGVIGWDALNSGYAEWNEKKVCSPLLQASYLQKLITSSAGSSVDPRGGIDLIVYFSFYTFGSDTLPTHALVRHNLTPRALYWAYIQIKDNLLNKNINRKIPHDSVQVFEFEDLKTGLRTWVLWWKRGWGHEPVPRPSVPPPGYTISLPGKTKYFLIEKIRTSSEEPLRYKSSDWSKIPVDTVPTFIKECFPIALIDDSTALAFNGNKHMVRDAVNNILHIVYTSDDSVYYYTLSPPFKIPKNITNLGKGKFPVIALDKNGNPCVAWTDDKFLLFSKKDFSGNWNTYSFTFPYIIGSFIPQHPSMTITDYDTVHILVRLYLRANGPQNYIKEISFPLDNPLNKKERTVDFSGFHEMKNLDFPSIAYSGLSINNQVVPVLIGVWQHEDTIYYGERKIGNPEWTIWKEVFDNAGYNAYHPSVEIFGDRVCIVWQRKNRFGIEEIYKASKFIWQTPENFTWTNLSRSLMSKSLYPVNSKRLYTFYVEKPLIADDIIPKGDVFYRTSPTEPAVNISQTLEIRSFYPHAEARITFLFDDLYVIWLEGNKMPYEIKFKKIRILKWQPPPPFLTSLGGLEIPPPYLIQRDTFFTEWQIPVDAGINTLKYEFPLEPGYQYQIRIIAYHESENSGNGMSHGCDLWKAKLKIDGKMIQMIKYRAFEPETVDIFIPESYYEDDGKIEVVFENKKGDYVTIGAIYVYQYEYAETEEYASSGVQEFAKTNKMKLIIPSFIKDGKIRLLNIPFKKSEIEIFDITGRKVYKGWVKEKSVIPFDKGSGSYILIIRDRDTGKRIKRKIIKLR